MSDKKFVTAINCMDGRTQLPVIEWLKREYKVDYVDMVTKPGPNKVLAEYNNEIFVESIKRRVGISINKHNSTLIAIVGHYDCAGNPADKQTQIEQIRLAIKNIQKWGFNVEVIGLWVDENWAVHRI